MEELIRELITLIIQKLKIFFSRIFNMLKLRNVINKIKLVLKMLVEKIFRIKPRDENDYYTIGNLMISKHLVSLIIFIMGILGIYYLLSVQTEFFGKDSKGVRIYSYNSIRLRFAEGTVKIKAKSGYIAYYGEVSDGKANGKGILYTRSGNIKYKGEFKDSEYSGNGKLYGDSNNLIYSGDFNHNQYQGNGILYKDNGTKEYEGEFDNGKKSGKGILYDGNNNPVYEGNFILDNINYNELPGKNTNEISQMYTGQRIIYYKGNDFIINMKDINAYYAASSEESYLDDEVMVNRIYIPETNCIIGGEKLDNIQDIKNVLGNIQYEGKSVINIQEAVVLNKLTEVNKEFEDVFEIISYENNKELYLTVFSYDDIQYTFYSSDKSDDFIMYSIER